ncbi:SDR family oxidoreductase [Saccharicrinis sp. FJH62]|uniref:SDR family oxidoreductase n=1 Tax=Saccharicrinis sp. FJH62 TaxID=3344657 RepID=UPI0035D3F530
MSIYKILVTGGAGFIGSNLCEYFLLKGHNVVCLDNLSTGKQENIDELKQYNKFTFVKGDISDFEDCKKAVNGVDYVFHQAALGSVPRSIADPVATNNANITGFLNMLVASRDEGVKRFVYAASSSTYGDSVELPKVEDHIGKPLSPYAITKYVNELYARNFSDLYGMETIGLRYFNVFGRRQDTKSTYAAVIPLWVKALLEHQQPVINGDASYTRDFTYIDNVLLANELAAFTPTETIVERAKSYNMNLSYDVHLNLVFNVACGNNTSLGELFSVLRNTLAKQDSEIRNIKPYIGQKREGDIPHSLASIEKAKRILNYKPLFTAEEGFVKACEWYVKNL